MAKPRTLALAVIGVIVALTGVAAPEDLSGAAYSTCQMFALDRLTRPATAHFPALGEPGTLSHISARRRAGRYQVESFVDFRNENGEPVRNRVYCDLHMLGPTHWMLERILMGDGDRRALERDQAAERAATEASLRRRALTEWVAEGFEKNDSVTRRRSSWPTEP